jgi:ribonuclease T
MIMPISDRFRGFLPVVLDVETSGFNPNNNAILEIAICIIRMDDFGRLFIGESIDANIEPFEGAVIDPRSLEFTGIDLDDPEREPMVEKEALRRVFATLGGLAFGQTVLSRAVQAAGLEWNEAEAHSAVYDTRKTAELFCAVVNQWKIATGR